MYEINSEEKPWDKNQPVWRYVFLVWIGSLLIAAIIPTICTIIFYNQYKDQILAHFYLYNRYGELPIAQDFFMLITGWALTIIPLPIGLAINTYTIIRKKGSLVIGWIVSIVLAIIIGIGMGFYLGGLSYV